MTLESDRALETVGERGTVANEKQEETACKTVLIVKPRDLEEGRNEA